MTQFRWFHVSITSSYLFIFLQIFNVFVVALSVVIFPPTYLPTYLLILILDHYHSLLIIIDPSPPFWFPSGALLYFRVFFFCVMYRLRFLLYFSVETSHMFLSLILIVRLSLYLFWEINFFEKVTALHHYSFIINYLMASIVFSFLLIKG